MERNEKEPVYTIGIVSNMLKVCPTTLRIWEKKGLIKPARIGKNRFYSILNLKRLELIKSLLRQGVNIEGIKGILHTTRCWDIKKCKPEGRKTCVVYLRYADYADI